MLATIAPSPLFSVRQAGVAEILPLRHAILRAGLPLSTARFPGDDAPTTFHAGAFTPSRDCIGCATLCLHPWQDRPAYQLRGMAVAHHLQRTGVGSALLAFLEDYARRTPIHLLWANARTPALNFYRKHGWTITGEEFHIPTAGPHYLILKPL